MSSLFGAGEPKPRSYADRARDGLAALGQKASDAQFEAEGLLGLRPKTAEEQLYEACCPSLSYQTRLIGFCACMFASFILALFASFMLRRLLWRGDAAPFAIAYTRQRGRDRRLHVHGGADGAAEDDVRAEATRLDDYLRPRVGADALLRLRDASADARFGCILASLFIQWLAHVVYALLRALRARLHLLVPAAVLRGLLRCVVVGVEGGLRGRRNDCGAPSPSVLRRWIAVPQPPLACALCFVVVDTFLRRHCPLIIGSGTRSRRSGSPRRTARARIDPWRDPPPRRSSSCALGLKMSG